MLHHLVDELAGLAKWELRVVIDVFVGVEASVVQQLKWSHGVSQPQLDSGVHILHCSVSSLNHSYGVLDIGTQQTVDNEARGVLKQNDGHKDFFL